MEPELDGLVGREPMLLQGLRDGVPVELFHADREVIDQASRILLPERHDRTVDTGPSGAQSKNSVGFVLTHRHQAKYALVELRRALEIAHEH